MPTSESVKDSLCVIPWIHSSTDSFGNIRICCMANLSPYGYLRRKDQTRHNAKTDSIPRNHEYYKDVRSQMIKGIRLDMCKQCWMLEESGLHSNRLVYNECMYPDEIERIVTLTGEDGEINPQDFPIRYYDLRFGTKCNSKCIICNNCNSSMWDDRVDDWTHGKLEAPYIKDLLKDVEYIDRLYITGGEPTVIQNHWDLLDILIKEGHAKNIAVDYNSNGVVLTKKMLETWSHFKSVGIGFSIDGMGKTYEQIRYPSKWKTIIRNLDLFDTYAAENTNGSFAMTILSLNVLNVIDFFKWYYAKKFEKIRIVPHFNILSRPLEMDIRRLDTEQKLIIEKQYDLFYEWIDQNCHEEEEIINEIKRGYSGIINAMRMEPFEI